MVIITVILVIITVIIVIIILIMVIIMVIMVIVMVIMVSMDDFVTKLLEIQHLIHESNIEQEMQI